MRKSVLVFVGIAVVIIIVGFIVVRQKRPSQTPNSDGSDIAGQSANNPANSNKLRSQPEFLPRTNQGQASIGKNPIPAVPVVVNTNYMTNWEEKLDAILADNDKPDPQKAKEMIDMFPQLSPDAQEEIAHHISNLTPDENYNLGQFLTNSALPEPVLDVFTEDVLNRPNNIKLPLLLDMASDPQHPKAGEAKDILELFLEEDFGNDWTKWHAKLDQWLKDNPD